MWCLFQDEDGNEDGGGDGDGDDGGGDGDGDGGGDDGDGDGGDDDKFFLQEVDATLTPGRDNWGMGSMGGHPMMNNGGEPVSGSLLILTIKMIMRINLHEKKYQ